MIVCQFISENIGSCGSVEVHVLMSVKAYYKSCVYISLFCNLQLNVSFKIYL